MPRPSWKGVLRLSLVSCPVYLLPATTKTKTIRLNQVWVPTEPPHARERMVPRAEQAPEDDDDMEEEPQPRRRSTGRDAIEPAPPPPNPLLTSPEPTGAATRISLRPHDPYTGAEVERTEVVKGYEYDRGQFVTFTPDELKALEPESTGAIDLSTFVPRADVDPLYFNTPYFVYPDGRIAVEAFGVLNAAMTEAGLAGIGRITLSRRVRLALVEPRDGGMVLITLRANEEVRAANFGKADADADPEMVDVAAAIINRRLGDFDPSTFRDSYQEGLKQLIDAKLKGLPLKTQPERAPAAVVDLMTALKRSLAQDTPPEPKSKPKSRATTKDRRQTNLLLPVPGKPRAAPTVAAPRIKRRKA